MAKLAWQVKLVAELGRKQATVVAENGVAVLEGQEPLTVSEGNGPCSLSVGRRKMILVEFDYGGKIMRRSEPLSQPQLLPDALAPHWSVGIMPATIADRRV